MSRLRLNKILMIFSVLFILVVMTSSSFAADFDADEMATPDSSVSTGEVAADTVSEGASDLNEGEIKINTSSKTYTNIKDAVSDADGNVISVTINIGPGVYNSTHSASYQLADGERNTNITINKTYAGLIINGAGQDKTILDGLGLDTFFFIDKCENITFSNLTFRNGLASFAGGAIYNTGDANNLTLINVSFINNTAMNGGAVYTKSALTTIINSTFINNTASSSSFYGGAVALFSNSMNVYRGELVVTGSKFINNTAARGSAIYMYYQEKTFFNINYNVFLSNKLLNGSDEYVVYSDFTGNYNYRNLDYNYWGSNVKNFRAYNSATCDYWVLLGALIPDNVGAKRNNELEVGFYQYTDGNQNYTLNHIMPEISVDLSTQLGTITTGNTVNISGLTPINYYSSRNGDETLGFEIDGNNVANVTFVVENAIVTELYVAKNGSDETGDGSSYAPYATIAYALSQADENLQTLYISKGNYTEHDLTVSYSISIIGEDGVIIDAENQGRIFVLDTNNTEVSFMNLVLMNGNSDFGSAIAADIKDFNIALSINSVKFINNTASSEGGAVCFVSAIGESFLSVYNCEFISNVANDAGAIMTDASTMIDNSKFMYNSAENTGAIEINAGTHIIQNTLFINNHANGKAGAIFVDSSSLTFISYSVFVNNTVDSIVDAVGANDESVIADYNYWGSNENPNEDVNYTNWVLLKAIAPEGAAQYETHQINLDFSKYMDTSNATGTLESSMPEISLEFEAQNGSVSPNPVVLTSLLNVDYFSMLYGKDTVVLLIDGYNVTSISFDVARRLYGDIYVSPDGDDENGDGSQFYPFKTIRYAIAQVNDNAETIYILDGIYNECNLTINHTVRIIGLGDVVIDAEKEGGIFEIVANDTEFKVYNMTLINGKNDRGAAILMGPFIRPVYCNVLVDGVKFIGHYVTYVGGAIYNGGGKNTDNEYSSLTVLNSVFSGNNATNSGALYSSGDLTIDKCTFTNNTARTGSGVVRLGMNSAFITNSLFEDNYCSIRGRAIELSGSAFKNISNCVFINNRGLNGNISDAVYMDTSYAGAAVADNNWWGTNDNPFTAKLTNINVTSWIVLSISADDNVVTAGLYKSRDVNGMEVVIDTSALPVRTISFAPEDIMDPSVADLVNGMASSTLTNNQTTIVYATVDNQTVKARLGKYTISDVYVSVGGDDANYGDSWDNSVKTVGRALEIVSDGGHIYIGEGEFAVVGIEINKSVAISGVNKSKSIINGLLNGSGIFVLNEVNASFENLTFKDGNKSNGRGGAIYAVNTEELNISNCIFDNNHASVLAGGAISIWAVAINTTLNVADSTFVNNEALIGAGSAIKVAALDDQSSATQWRRVRGNATVNIINSTFANNTADGKGTLSVEISTGVGLVNVADSVFDNNKANDGGAISAIASLQDNADVNVTVNIIGSNFTNNTAIPSEDASACGGAIYVDSRIAELNIDASIFRDNKVKVGNAINYGGAIALVSQYYMADLDIQNSIIVNNSADVSSAIFYLANSNGNINIENNWWGLSEPDWDALIGTLSSPDKYLTLVSSYENLSADNYNIIANLYWNGTTDQSGLENFADLNINLYCPVGTLEKSKGIFENGSFSSKYTGNGEGVYIIDIAVDLDYQTIIIGNADLDGSFRSLNNSIANANGVLNLSTNYKKQAFEYEMFPTGIIIDKDIVINGNGCVISADDHGMIFTISGATMVLNNVTLVFASTEGIGGAIYNQGTLIINNSVIANNSAYGGAAVYNLGTLIIDNSEFYKNTANGWDGGVVYNDGSLIINNSRFSNNSARNGGVVASQVETTVVAESSEFIGNAAESGAAFYFEDAMASINYNSIFNNSAAIVADEDSKVNIENNWWGNNTPDFANLLNGVESPEAYLVLNTSYVNTSSSEFDITANLYWNGTDSQSNMDMLPDLDIELIASGGAFSQSEGIFENGVFSTIFTADAGLYTIQVIVDNEIQVLSINSTLPPKKTIQELIDEAEDGATIVLESNYTYADVSDVNITKNLTILGGENTIVSAGEAVVFNILPDVGNVAVSGISFIARNNDTVFFKAVATDNALVSEIAAIEISDNVFFPYNGVNPNSIDILDVVSDSAVFNPSNPIVVSGNTFVSGMSPFVLESTYWEDDSGIVIPVADAIETTISIDEVSAGEGFITATLKDINGLALAGKTVRVYVGDVENNYTSSEDGKIIVDALKSNNMVLFLFEGDGSYDASNASVNFTPSVPEKKATVIVCDNMTTSSIVSSRTGEYFIAKLTDSDGKPLAGKNVQIGFNGKIYERTTNESGEFRLQVNLVTVGGYTFAISFLGDDEYNASFAVAKITVVKADGTITVSPTTISKSKLTNVKLAFNTSRGIAITGQTVYLKVNGKTYSAKTDSEGIATVKVSISAKGSFSYTAWFDGNTKINKVTKTGRIAVI